MADLGGYEEEEQHIADHEEWMNNRTIDQVRQEDRDETERELDPEREIDIAMGGVLNYNEDPDDDGQAQRDARFD